MSGANRVLQLSLLIALSVACIGCSSDDPVKTDPEDDTPATVTISPDSAALSDVGVTVQFEATARDGEGDTLNVAINWSSTDQEVVVVSSSGLAGAVGEGIAWVIAVADTIVDSAKVTVTVPTPDPTVYGTNPNGGSRDDPINRR